MARSRSDGDLRVSGLQLWARFTLAMSLALALVMAAAGYLLFTTTTRIAQDLQEDALVVATQSAARKPAQSKDYWQDGLKGTELRNDQGAVQRFPVRLKEGTGYLYRARLDGREANIVVPHGLADNVREGLFGLIIGISSAVILIGALVAFLIANQVSSPLQTMIEDIRQIAHGNLRHRTRVRTGGEVALLAKTVDRMAASLADAQETQLELSVRDREMEVAGEVREALLPEGTPLIDGLDIAAAHLSSPLPGGDFHEFVEYPDGRVGFLVCDVSGAGVPGALVGATARSYLRAMLQSSEDDIEGAFKRVNIELARDVRRGMYVTAMYVLVDPVASRATVVCAGHKIPIVRYVAAEKKVSLLQPEGIALGFDKGPVFDRSLAAEEIDFNLGDRLVLANTGPVLVQNEDGEELGEKAFYKIVARYAARDSMTVLKGVRKDLEEFAGEEPFPADISLVTLSRQAPA